MHLIDTRLVLGAAFNPGRLPPKAAKILQSRAVPLAFSLVTIWEVAITTSLGRADFSVDPGRLHHALHVQSFLELPKSAVYVDRVAVLPRIHRDRFDRLLVAQAMEEKLTLLTADAVLKGYGRFVKVY